MEDNKQSQTNQYKYHAFISYRHADNKVQGRQWATWLHQAIETYEVPKDLVGKKNGRGDVIPARIYPIFRDEEELPAHADLGTSIVGALEQTNLLVVLCSPRAVASTYVADEIDYFKKLGGSDRIIAAMIDGEPNTSWDESKHKLGFTKEDECFPLPLQFEYDQDGNPTDKHAEPIAADFRINNNGTPEEGWTTPAAYREHLKATTQLDNKAIDKKVDTYQQQLHLMLLKIIAGILGVPLGELTQRDKEYQLEQERLKAKKLRLWLGAVAMLAILAVGAGGVAYSQKEKASLQRQQAISERNRAEKMLNQVRANLKFMNYDLRDVLNKYAPTTARTAVLKRVDTLVETLQVQVSEEEKKKDKLDIANSFVNKAALVLLNSETNPQEALALLIKAHEIFKELVQLSPESQRSQTALSVSHDKLGDLRLGLGETTPALAHYQASLDIRKKLIDLDPNNIQLQRNLSVSQNQFGDLQLSQGNTARALEHYQASMVISKKLTEFRPSNTEYQSDLSRSHHKLGGLQLRLGNTAAALVHYQASLDISKRLTGLDSSNMQFQRDLSISHNKLGGLQLELGNTELAVGHYQASMFLRIELTELDPNNTQFQRDLSISYDMLGNLQLRSGNTAQALASYHISLDIRKKLTEHDPINTEFLRDLSISNDKLGSVELRQANTAQALAHYQESLKLRKKLTELTPINTQFQSDYSLSHIQLGGVQLKLGNIAPALKHYQAGVNIYKKLIELDPSNVVFQNNLSVSHEKLGNLQLRLGNIAPALANYQSSLNIVKKRTELEPSNTKHQDSLLKSYYKLATYCKKEGQHKKALTYYKNALSILSSGVAKYDKKTHQKYFEIITTGAKLSEGSLSN